MSARVIGGEAAEISPFAWPSVGSGEMCPASTGKSHSALAGAREQAGQTSFDAQLEEAKREVAVLKVQQEAATRAAYQQGFDDGNRQATETARGQIEGLQRQVAQSLAAVAQARTQVLTQADHDLVRLSVAIAEKILHRQVHVDANALRGIARAALERLDGKPALAVRLHPEDQQALAAELAGLEAKGTAFLTDASIPRGSLVVETSLGNLDASIHTQLEEIERGLVDRLQRSQP